MTLFRAGFIFGDAAKTEGMDRRWKITARRVTLTHESVDRLKRIFQPTFWFLAKFRPKLFEPGSKIVLPRFLDEKTAYWVEHGGRMPEQAQKIEGINAARNQLGENLKHIRENDSLSANPDRIEKLWKYWNSPLKEYPRPPSLYTNRFRNKTFEEFLEDEVLKAEKEGRKLRVLDIGAGEGTQWLEFLKKHRENLELHVTTLSPKVVNPEIKGLARVVHAHAANLHKRFKPDYFDVVVTNQGIHYQPLQAIENAVHLLKPGAQAFMNDQDIDKKEWNTQELAQAIRKGVLEILYYEPHNYIAFSKPKP